MTLTTVEHDYVMNFTDFFCFFNQRIAILGNKNSDIFQIPDN